MIKYHKGDLFCLYPKDKPVYITHVVNNIGVFGGGFTAGLEKYMPEVGKEYRRLNTYILGTNQWVMIDKGLYVVNMIAQNHTISKNNPKPIRYSTLISCMNEIYGWAKRYSADIWCPKFGSELAGGKWELIEELINEIWRDLNVNVCVL